MAGGHRRWNGIALALAGCGSPPEPVARDVGQALEAWARQDSYERLLVPALFVSLNCELAVVSLPSFEAERVSCAVRAGETHAKWGTDVTDDDGRLGRRLTVMAGGMRLAP